MLAPLRFYQSALEECLYEPLWDIFGTRLAFFRDLW